MKAIFRAVHPVLGAHDVRTAVKWYVVRLGFTCTFDDGTEPIRYAAVRRDAVELHLQWQDDRYFPDPGDDAPAYRFLIDNPDALYDEYAHTPVHSTPPPACAIHRGARANSASTIPTVMACTSTGRSPER